MASEVMELNSGDQGLSQAGKPERLFYESLYAVYIINLQSRAVRMIGESCRCKNMYMH